MVREPTFFVGRSNQNAVKRGNSSGRGSAVSTAYAARRQAVLAGLSDRAEIGRAENAAMSAFQLVTD